MADCMAARRCCCCRLHITYNISNIHKLKHTSFVIYTHTRHTVCIDFNLKEEKKSAHNTTHKKVHASHTFRAKQSPKIDLCFNFLFTFVFCVSFSVCCSPKTNEHTHTAYCTVKRRTFARYIQELLSQIGKDRKSARKKSLSERRLIIHFVYINIKK